MKKIAIAIAVIFMLCFQSCSSVTYFTYYEVDSLELANIVSKADGIWSRTGHTPTRCIGCYQDSTGCVIYLMEEKVKEPKKNFEDHD